ncbi:MAG: hypothetical protein Q8R48_05255, partial [Candidatus Omnitrophota bacterium]|nr:hypothetical protein [Candidatus Omnitrophota bacterium]
MCIRKGYLKGIKIGRNWVTRPDWFLEYISSYRPELLGTIEKALSGKQEGVYSISDTAEKA